MWGGLGRLGGKLRSGSWCGLFWLVFYRVQFYVFAEGVPYLKGAAAELFAYGFEVFGFDVVGGGYVFAEVFGG